MGSYLQQSLGHILRRAKEPVAIDPSGTYRQVTVRLFHRGVVLRGEKPGSAIRTTRQWLVRQGQVLLSRIDARNGAIGIVPPDLEGAVVTNDFWAFEVNPDFAISQFLDLYFGTAEFVEACNRASEGTTNRVRLQPDDFLRIEVPLPPLDEQRRIVSHIKELTGKLDEAHNLQLKADLEAQRLLHGAYSSITANVPVRRMSAVAPLVRRPVEINLEDEYPELGVRSFGKGTFQKAPIIGAALGTKKIFEIKAGDLLFNIVFAWEGAVAVAKREDGGRVGSHRFLTCVPREGVATAGYLCFHFLTEMGLDDLGRASPGGAGRNRTLGLEKLAAINVPVPSYEKQVWFEEVQAKVDALRKLQAETVGELDALTPSILAKAFSGEL